MDSPAASAHALPRWRLALAGAAVAALSLALSLILRDLWRDRDGGIPDRPVELAIGRDRLTVAANLIRFSDQRAGGELPRVDLWLLWPEMKGMSAETAARFDDVSDASKVIQIGIEPRETELASSERLATLYARYFDGDAFDGPGGLVGRRFLPSSSYADELLFFEPGSVRPFVARCFAKAGGSTVDLCLSEFRVGASLIAAYRFRPALLAQWKEMDDQIRALTAGLVKAP